MKPSKKKNKLTLKEVVDQATKIVKEKLKAVGPAERRLAILRAYNKQTERLRKRRAAKTRAAASTSREGELAPPGRSV
jgi:hypothetical protein